MLAYHSAAHVAARVVRDVWSLNSLSVVTVDKFSVAFLGVKPRNLLEHHSLVVSLLTRITRTDVVGVLF